MGVVVFTSEVSVVEVIEDEYEFISNIEIMPPVLETMEDRPISSGSTLIANAEFLNPEGKPILLSGVKFYLNGQLMSNDQNVSTQKSPPYTLKFDPPTLPDRFVWCHNHGK